MTYEITVSDRVLRYCATCGLFRYVWVGVEDGVRITGCCSCARIISRTPVMDDVAQRKSGAAVGGPVAGSIPVIAPNDIVSVTSMVVRRDGHEKPWRGRRQMRRKLMRLVRTGELQCRPRDTVTGRGGRVLFSRRSGSTSGCAPDS